MDVSVVTEKHILKEWRTPNTYNTNYAIPDPVGGVYVIFGYRIQDSPAQELECIYVGASKNLYKRYIGHPVRGIPDFWWCGFFWKQCDDPFAVEKLLIKKLKPLLNKQHNG